jgi:2-oxoisovalerate dehydrogenase E1 component
MRVRNFPPDETAILGAALGMSHAGFNPIVEIPYAKYLDCASDIFAEIVVLCWLSNRKQASGLFVRLQGFGPGVFGGNFHTHNALTLMPGLDVVCYSNGYDYVKGIRYCLRQAKAGRVIMSVDSTDLLNRRHLDDTVKDEFMLHGYPHSGEEMSFDEVVVYQTTEGSLSILLII